MASEVTWVYKLELREGEFEARGLDEATRITRRLNEALQAALEHDHEVISATMVHLRVRGSEKNYLQGAGDAGSK